jgi:hypothetical protein
VKPTLLRRRSGNQPLGDPRLTGSPQTAASHFVRRRGGHDAQPPSRPSYSRLGGALVATASVAPGMGARPVDQVLPTASAR